jgi:glutathione S-transferase
MEKKKNSCLSTRHFNSKVCPLSADFFDMIELIQFPWSPFCIVQRRILEFSGTPFKIINIPNQDRSLVWKLTKERYYGVPVIRDGKNVIFEMSDDSQVIAKYLDEELDLGLFPTRWRGVQSVLWVFIEDEIEGCTFRLNDIYWNGKRPQSRPVAVSPLQGEEIRARLH